jgi:multisubunit Na+/H+ antiporter MnhB subunit
LLSFALAAGSGVSLKVRRWIAIALPALIALASVCTAQSLPDSTRYSLSARYQFGAACSADPNWTSPSFHDSDWKVLDLGPWPKPAYPADGIICARFTVPIPAGASTEPLALRQINAIQLPGQLFIADLPDADEIYLNGALLSRRGSLPPNPVAVMQRGQTVFPIPSGLIQPGATSAIVAARVWMQPGRLLDGAIGPQFVLDRAEAAKTAAREEAEFSLLTVLPILAAFAAMFLLGVGLLAFWRVSHESDLGMFGFALISFSVFILFMSISHHGYLPISRRLWALFYAPVQFLAPFSAIYFAWHFLEVPSRFLKWLAYAFCAAMTLCATFSEWIHTPYSFLPALYSVEYWANFLMGLLIIGAGMWGLARRPGKRLMAFVLILNPTASNLSMAFNLPPITFGPVSIGALSFTSLATGVVMAGILLRGAWKNWRGSSGLRKEMDAAREVQQQLVGAMPETPGFAVRAAYLPASQVGGDFYRVTPLAGGGLLLIVGDVSGKGLRAAMTVSAIMGALRAISSESPGTILTLLNHTMDGQLRGGFVTCCVVRVNAHGEARIANAGHLPPYIAGREITLPSAFPLGIMTETVYTETIFQLAPGERFTVLSDGVIEARDGNGEIFGFERTEALSTDTADNIAKTAQKFGQEDDITVVTVAFLRGLGV